MAEWLRRVPAKYMGFPRESSNLSGVAHLFWLFATLFFSALDLQLISIANLTFVIYADPTLFY